MSLVNPTRLKIGRQGQFHGRHYQLTGRAVLGITENGEKYYWQEFYLTARNGEVATLVYEKTERGGEWRFFNRFEPESPLTAEDAASRRVGDVIDLNGTDVLISRVDTAKVYRVEGEVPCGITVGEVSKYFNAEANDIMQVVSWIGERVECYDGINVSSELVRAAFNLPGDPVPKSFWSSQLLAGSASGSGNSLNFPLLAISGFILLLVILNSAGVFYRRTSITPLKRVPPGLAPLAVGQIGIIKGKTYHVTAHAVVEIGEVGIYFEHHEYRLTNDDGQVALLVCGWRPPTKNWILFQPLQPLVSPTAAESAMHKMGETVNVDGVAGSVREIFQSVINQADPGAPFEWMPGATRYGYLAKSNYGWLLARWDSFNNEFESGTELPAQDILATFTKPAH